MPYNNKRFGNEKDALTKSIFNYGGDFPIPKPPPGSFKLITDSGNPLITDQENYLITD
jgi:hypothetical protein